MAIPFYIDEEQMMENHPLIEWVNSLFALDRYSYRLSDIMRFFQDGIVPIDGNRNRTG